MSDKNIPEEEYTPEIVSVIDDDGIEHLFEELDRIETDDGKYIALIPVIDDEVIDDEDEGIELIILNVDEESDGNAILSPIEDPKVFEEIAAIFEERLIDTDEN